MPYLGDYLGHLLSEITIARMQADLEAVRVAELYASHPLLRTFPVPHFRLPDVDLDLPVVIKQVEDPRPGESPRGGMALADIRKTFDRVLAKQLQQERIHTTPDEREKLRQILDEKIASLGQPTEVAVDVARISDQLTSVTTEFLRATAQPRGGVEPGDIQRFEKALKHAARIELLEARKTPPRLQVLVTTQEIREAGPSEVITRLRLKVSEQGVEWTTVEADGRTQDRLVPE